jgi:hypothetical protein
MHTRRGATAVARRGTSRNRWAFAGVIPVALALVLAGCTPEPSTPATSAAPESSAPATASSTPTAPAGQLNPAGSAADNKAFFDSVNQALIASNPAAGGVEFTSNLRSNGFDITAMQVTADTTTVGVAADSIQFSVHWGDDCLIGQYGQGQYSSIVAPALGTGACLVGQTRAIDW